jgi:small subunit ribosomal protein S18
MNSQPKKDTKRMSTKKGAASDKKGQMRNGTTKLRRRVLSLTQLLGSIKQKKFNKNNAKRNYKNARPIKPIIPPKSLVIILKEKPEKAVYNRRIIDYKHCGLLQRYIGLGGKILPRRQTRLSAKQQRYIAKTIKSARIMGLLPFVSKEKGFFR